MNTLRMIYGTAWKEDKTEELCLKALEKGFEGIDTANQRKHYYEEGVGKALKRFFQKGEKKREDIFIQTKFTFPSGQDHRLPYDSSASVATQVRQSFQSSLEHLGVEYINSYLLHGPAGYSGLISSDREAWKSMESLAKESKTRQLGLSNVNLEQLQLFYKEAVIKPAYVQNRCYASRGWDKEIRQFCSEHQIGYQGFSLLTANMDYLRSPPLAALVKKYERTLPQIIFRFCTQIGILVITGTSDSRHMEEDLKLFDFELSPEDMYLIENISKA